MSEYRHLELLSGGRMSKVRLLNRSRFCDEVLAELVSEWNSIADHTDCNVLCADCSNVQLISSDLLSKLILLHRRLKLKKARLVLSGLSDEVREVLRWTRLDRFFEINENEREESVKFGVDVHNQLKIAAACKDNTKVATRA